MGSQALTSHRVHGAKGAEQLVAGPSRHGAGDAAVRPALVVGCYEAAGQGSGGEGLGRPRRRHAATARHVQVSDVRLSLYFP